LFFFFLKFQKFEFQYQTTLHMSSLPHDTPGYSFDFTSRGVQEEDESNTPEQEAD
jgi:hypothetical protein